MRSLLYLGGPPRHLKVQRSHRRPGIPSRTPRPRAWDCFVFRVWWLVVLGCRGVLRLRGIVGIGDREGWHGLGGCLAGGFGRLALNVCNGSLPETVRSEVGAIGLAVPPGSGRVVRTAAEQPASVVRARDRTQSAVEEADVWRVDIQRFEFGPLGVGL